MPPLIEQSTAPDAVRRSSVSKSSLVAKEMISTPARGKSPLSFLDELLAEQQTLTAVARFARKHEQHELPAQARFYRDLIPLAKPQPGEQYAFTVDLDKCSGCKACVSACHSLNGLDEGEMWRGVGLLVGEVAPLARATPASPCGEKEAKPVAFRELQSGFQQHITTACHHCVEPACADGCPVLAYEKDPVTGIVRHLDDQCIGCQYCVMKCPYEVPKFSSARGIVRKCDMCHSRLAAGEAPACVQACPHEAIRIEIVNQAAVRTHFETVTSTANPFLPGSPEPRITLPTTRYISAKPLPVSGRPADADALRLEPAHWPLVLMLVLTQLAGGLHLLHGILFSAGWTEPLPVLARFAMCALLVGLVASVAHLGRPLKAWRAFLGWRRSWMSREIIAFSIYAALASLLVCWPGNGLIAQATAVTAVGGIACSAMIYVDTKRAAWSATSVFTNFFGTMLLLGATAGTVWAGWLAPALAAPLAILAMILRVALFGWEWAVLLRARNDSASPLHHGAQTVLCLLRPVLAGRVILFVASVVFTGLVIFNVAGRGPIWGVIACVSTLAGQMLERYTFFAGCSGPRMPGGIA